MKNKLKAAAKKYLSSDSQRKIIQYTNWPPVGFVQFGNLRRLSPIDTEWGFSRGLPLDRYYIERFLSTNENDIKGKVLEVKDNYYTKKFGGDKVQHSDVLHKKEGNSIATVVADISVENDIPSDTYDCIIFTQTLQFIYDVKPAINTLHRILKKNGTLLVTLPVISQISPDDMKLWGDYWRFTSVSSNRMFGEVFEAENIDVQAVGNIMVSTAFLYGLASEELKQKELDYIDPNYEFLITIKATK